MLSADQQPQRASPALGAGEGIRQEPLPVGRDYPAGRDYAGAGREGPLQEGMMREGQNAPVYEGKYQALEPQKYQTLIEVMTGMFPVLLSLILFPASEFIICLPVFLAQLSTILQSVRNLADPAYIISLVLSGIGFLSICVVFVASILSFVSKKVFNPIKICRLNLSGVPCGFA